MKLSQAFNTPRRARATPLGSAGYDNARENIDPQIKTKTVSTSQGTIQQVPVNNNDIVNKKYVDDNNYWDASGTNIYKTNTGNVGIGTTNPGALLEVSTSTAGEGAIIGNVETGNWGLGSTYAVWKHKDVSNSGYALVQDSNGNTFFGTARKMAFNVAGMTRWAVSPSGGFAFGLDYDSLEPGANNMIIQGNVGIGTTSPDEKLHVNGRIIEDGTFANIYVDDGSTAQSIPTGTTYTKLTGFATNGQSSNCTTNVANDKITITKTGKYMVNYSMNGSSGSSNITFKTAAFLNGSEQEQIHSHRKYAASGDKGSESGCGIINVTTANWDLDLRTRHDSGSSVNYTPTYMSLNVYYLGE